MNHPQNIEALEETFTLLGLYNCNGAPHDYVKDIVSVDEDEYQVDFEVKTADKTVQFDLLFSVEWNTLRTIAYISYSQGEVWHDLNTHSQEVEFLNYLSFLTLHYAKEEDTK